MNFLAARPGESFTLSELGKHLAVNPASLHALLVAMQDDGYLVRDPARKTYRLGMSLVAIGQAALDEHPVIQRVRAEGAALAEQLDVECLSAVIVGDEFLVVAEAGRPDRLFMRPRVGQRMPFMPPISGLAAGLLGEEALESWLARLGPDATDHTKDDYRRSVAIAMKRGYEVGLDTPTRDSIGMVMQELVRDPKSPKLRAKLIALIAQLGREEHQLTEFKPRRAYRVNNIGAPVFGARGEFITGVTILGFDKPLEATKIQEYLAVVIETANRITRSTGGRIRVTA